MNNINTYLSPIKCGEKSVLKQRGSCVLSGNNITAYLVPLSEGKITQGLITVQFQKLGTDPFIDAPVVTPISIVLDTANPPYYKIIVSNPVYNLDKWIKTFITVFGFNCKVEPRIWAGPVLRTSGLGPIPEFKSGVVTPAGPFTYAFNINSIVPGENVCAQWEFFDGSYHMVKNEKYGVFWKTTYLSGGYIKSKVGEYQDPDLTFIVTVEGEDITCYPSDFMPWNVGDYVFIAKYGDKNFIIPIKVNNKGQGGISNIKEYAINEMPALLKTLFTSARLLSVDAVNNKASIVDHNNIDIFYHVPDGNSVSITDGGQAFKVDDLVLIWKLDNDYKIIGFTDGLHSPTGLRTLFTLSGPCYDLFYNSVLNEMYCLDRDNYKIVKTNLNGLNQQNWIPRANLGGGIYNLIEGVPDAFSCLEKESNGDLYFPGIHNYISILSYWDENFFYGGSYDEENHPVTIFQAALTKNYRIRFDSSQNFTCYDLADNSVVGTGSILSDFTTDYFSFSSLGWTGSFGPGDMIDFSTQAAGVNSINGIFKNTFNLNSGFKFYNLNDFYYIRFHYCQIESALFVLGWKNNNDGTFKLSLRKYNSVTEFEEKIIENSTSSSSGDFCHDCENNIFYIQHVTVSSGVYTHHIVSFNWVTDDKTDWSVGWLPHSFQITEGIAFNPDSSKLYIAVGVVLQTDKIYKCSFNSANYDSIVCEGESPKRLKFYDALYIACYDGKVIQYKE